MSILIKGLVGIAVMGGVAVLPAPASHGGTAIAPAAHSAPAPHGVAALPASRAVQLAQDVGESDCFVARKKSVKRKASNYVRLVKVCE